MDLNEFIGTILQQLEVLPEQFPNKRNYLIDELEFEINVAEITHANGGINIQILNLGRGNQQTQAHRIKVKLKPRLNNRQR